MQQRINIAILDEQPLFREGIKLILEKELNFNVIANTYSFSKICIILTEKSINVLLIDSNLFISFKNLLSGHIINLHSNMKIILMSTTGKEVSVTEALNFGVSGYILKSIDILTFSYAIQLVLEDKYYICPSLVGDLIDKYLDLANMRKVTPLPKRPPDLTKREYEMLELFIEGKTNREISKILSISEKTVKNHISNLFKRMNVSSRTQAVVKALKSNWLSLHNEIKESNTIHNQSKIEKCIE